MKKKVPAAFRDRQTGLSLILLGMSILVGLATSCSGKTERPIRHVILITVDTLRQDALSVYGSHTPTPHIDAFARDAMIFRRAYAVAPWTLPSLASLMTGLSPKVHQVTSLRSRLTDDVMTLAEYLRDAGYSTAALGVNDLLGPESGFGQGFSHYDFRRRSTAQLSQEAIRWLEEKREEDFFLWVHYLDPHAAYEPPSQFLPQRDPPERIGLAFNGIPALRHGEFVPSEEEKTWIRTLYEGEVRYVDASLGALFRALKEMDLYDDSLVVVTSDHGEEFWEHGSVGHKHTLYDELLRVPLILKLPSSVPTEETSVPVALPALMPTIMDLCGMTYDKENLSYGSLVPLWTPTTPIPEPQPITSHRAPDPEVGYADDLESVILGENKYIRSSSPGRNREELYNLAADPGEKNSLVESTPEIVQQAQLLLDADADQAAELRASLKLESLPPRGIPEELKERLKALGYLR